MTLLLALLVGLAQPTPPTTDKTVLFEPALVGLPVEQRAAVLDGLREALAARLVGALEVAPPSQAPADTARALGASRFITVRIEPDGGDWVLRAAVRAVVGDAGAQVRLVTTRAGLRAALSVLAQSVLTSSDVDAVPALTTVDANGLRSRAVPTAGGLLHRQRTSVGPPPRHVLTAELMRDRISPSAGLRYTVTFARGAHPQLGLTLAPLYEASVAVDGGFSRAWSSGLRASVLVRLRQWLSRDSTALGLATRWSWRLGPRPGVRFGLGLAAYTDVRGRPLVRDDEPVADDCLVELAAFTGIPW